MHQQIRVALAAPSSTGTGGGAMAVVPVDVGPYEVNQRALLQLLKLLASRDYNIRAASGHDIETGGEFVFAVEDDDDRNLPSEIAAFLEENGFRRRVRVVEPFHKDVDDHVGALAEAVEAATQDGSSVKEILVGLPAKEGVPIQITTLRRVGSERA